MNNKGFTLIELLAVIVVLGVVLTIVATSVGDSVQNSKKEAYNILIENIKSASKNYFMECRYGDSRDNGCDDTRYSKDAKTLTVTIKDLVTYGFLTPSEKNSTQVINPKTGNDISKCNFTIQQSVDVNDKYKVAYSFTVNSNCIEIEDNLVN